MIQKYRNLVYRLPVGLGPVWYREMMHGGAIVLIAALAGWFSATGAMAHSQPPAKELFGAKSEPAALAPEAVGSYAKGCLAGARSVDRTGPHHQVMRLSRNRNWGHPAMVEYLERLAPAAAQDGWPGLLIGDLAQPRGGPMLTGHASHQIGLDADIWLNPMPARVLSNQEREEISARSVLTDDLQEIDRTRWTDAHVKLVRRAALDSQVARIFVNPVIKRELCESAGSDRNWLRKIRPWWGHHYHFHVRLSCPAGSSNCANQASPPPGDGCGAELQSWFKPQPKPDKNAPPPKQKPPMLLAHLPSSCAGVLNAE